MVVARPAGVFHVVVSGWARAYVVVGGLLGLVLLAALVSLTTRTTAIVDAVVRGAGRCLGWASTRNGSACCARWACGRCRS